MLKKLYLWLAIVGWALPYYFFVAFLVENGLDLGLLLDQLLLYFRESRMQALGQGPIRKVGD